MMDDLFSEAMSYHGKVSPTTKDGSQPGKKEGTESDDDSTENENQPNHVEKETTDDGYDRTPPCKKPRCSGNTGHQRTLATPIKPNLHEGLRCIFLKEKPIPIWPRYRMPKSKNQFIKVHCREEWFAAVYRDHMPGKKPAGDVRPATAVCNSIVATIKAEVAKARDTHAKATVMELPPFIKVTFGKCLLTVSTHLRAIMVEADEDCYEWIGRDLPEVIRKTVTAQASSQDSETETPPGNFHFSTNTGIREKINWDFKARTWTLLLKNPPQELGEYLRERKLTLTVDGSLERQLFLEAKELCFFNAVKAWNDLDRSKKLRIKLPGKLAAGTISIEEQEGVQQESCESTDSSNEVEDPFREY